MTARPRASSTRPRSTPRSRPRTVRAVTSPLDKLGMFEPEASAPRRLRRCAPRSRSPISSVPPAPLIGPAHAGHLSLHQLKVMSAIEHCRTAALGGHVEACEDCGHRRIAYNSCRNRHCPKCQGAAARTTGWPSAQADLLPVGYFHVVFTVPAEVADIAFQNKAVVYDLLFRAASETHAAPIAADPRTSAPEIGVDRRAAHLGIRR